MRCEVVQRTKCRVCGGEDFADVISFTQMPFTDEFLKPGREGEEFLSDIRIVWCKGCQTAQNLCDVHVEDYYRDYQYTVSGSGFADRFMNRLAEELCRQFHLGSGDRIIEVGSGDGRQLQCFQKHGLQVLGFEPSDQLTASAAAAQVPTIKTLFSGKGISLIPKEMRPAQAILLTYTFDHLPDPAEFLDLAREVLDPQEGLLVLEVHDFAKIIERREICLFEHEHLVYLTALSMDRLLQRHGFRTVTTNLLSENERRGNSLLVVAAPLNSTRQGTSLHASPLESQLESCKLFPPFAAKVQTGIDKLQAYIRSLRAQGKVVAGYGAGGRGVMTTAMAGLGPDDLLCLCDQNSAFHGLLTPRSHIPVQAPEYLLLHNVDELIVFSYGYIDEIRQFYGDKGLQNLKLTSVLDYL
jgi:SAM-dependent methyltransferase